MLVSVPVYVDYVGVEGYALVGLFISLQAIVAVLDLGLSATVARELATAATTTEEKRDFLRTAEVAFFAISVATFFLVAIASPLLPNYVTTEMRSDALSESFLVMAVCLGLQFPVGIYSAALLGLQRQVTLAAVNISFAFVRILGTVAALHFISAQPQTIFGWLAASTAMQIAALAWATWSSMPDASGTARFRASLVKKASSFTIGVTGIAVMSVLLTQVDKLVLARVLTLEAFGYYMIAAVLALSLHRFIQPIFQVYFPRMTDLVSRGKETPVAEAYHQGSQLVAVLTMPTAALCIFFPSEILSVWQGRPDVVANSSSILALLSAGSCLNALLFVPYALQLAHGWTRFYFVALFTCVVLAVPATVALSWQAGGAGAAVVWLGMNLALVFLVVPVVHRRLLPGETPRWLTETVLYPGVTVTAVTVFGRLLIDGPGNFTFLLIQLGIVWTLATLLACLSAKLVRGPVLRMVGFTKDVPELPT